METGESLSWSVRGQSGASCRARRVREVADSVLEVPPFADVAGGIRCSRADMSDRVSLRVDLVS